MTTGSGGLAAKADSFARDWQAVRANHDIQFAPVQMPKPQPPPEWLRKLGEWLARLLRPIGRWLGEAGPSVPWIVGGIALVLVLFMLWRLRDPIAVWLGP